MIIDNVKGINSVSVSDGELSGTLNVDDYDKSQTNITLELIAELEMPFAYSTDALSFSQSNTWNETIHDNYVKMYVLFAIYLIDIGILLILDYSGSNI